MSPDPVTPAALAERLDRLPRAALAHLPTPLENCPRAAADLGLGSLRIKRDDCTGLGFGGNKVRQHEFILGDAIALGCDVVIQGSASQSNHSRQLAAAGAKLGLEVQLLPKLDRRSSPIQGNFLIAHLFGAHMHAIAPEASTVEAKERLAEALRAEGRRPYLIGMGAERSLTLAAVAYVGAFLELLSQGSEPPETIITASQGSTQAGLLVAARALGLTTRVIGINPLDARHEAYSTPAEILEIARGAAALLDVTPPLAPADIENLTQFVGPSYGEPSPEGLQALHFLGSREGILLDPVYSSKSFAGLMALSEQLAGEDVIYLHTGGLPALFAYADHLVPDQTAVGTR